MSGPMALTETLEAIRKSAQGEKISFGAVIEALNHRGFGALLIGPALITVMPTGAIPGVPAVCALFIILVAAQIIMGRSYPWLPQRLSAMSFSRKTYEKGLERISPYTKKIDGFFHPRLRFLTDMPAQKIIAIFCIMLGILIIGVGFIPFVPVLPAAAILLFGLGLSVHDGLLALLGFVMMGAALAVIPFLVGS